MHDSRTVFPLPFLAKTPTTLPPSSSSHRASRSGSPVSGSPPITRGLRQVAGSSTNRANGEPGSTAGWVRACCPGVFAADPDPEPARDPVGGDVDPAGRDHFQLAEPLGHVPAADLAGPLAGAAGVDQHLIAEQRVAVLEQVGAVQAEQRREPVPRRLAGLPRGGLVAAGPGGADRVMPAQPPVPAAGGGQVQDAQQVLRAGQRPQLGPGGDPCPGGRGDRGDLGAGQVRMLGVAGPALTRSTRPPRWPAPPRRPRTGRARRRRA